MGWPKGATSKKRRESSKNVETNLAFFDSICAGEKCQKSSKVSTDNIRHFSMMFVRADFWEGDATKHFLVKKRKRVFSEKRGGNSVNQGFGKDL